MTRIGNATAAVPFFLGCLDSVRAPGPLVVRGLGDLGIPAATARTTLHRMVHRGQLSATRVGRVTVYEMQGSLLGGWQRVRDGAEPPRPAWSGGLDAIVYEVGEEARRARDELRTAAFAARWAAARPGVLIGVTPRTAEMDRAIEAARAAGGTVSVGRFECALDTAQQLASTAWGLPALAADLRAAAARVRSVRAGLDRAGGPGGLGEPGGPGGRDGPGGQRPLAAYRALAQVYVEGVGTQLRDPGLPPELLPQPWPAQEMIAERLRLTIQVMPLVWRYVADLLNTSTWPQGVPGPGSSQL